MYMGDRGLKCRVAKNYIYNLIYQVAVLIIPLVTAPYLARILGAEGIGVYSYYYSIAYYFCIIAMLGVNNYGNRSIAKCLGDKEEINRVFSEVYYMQLGIGTIVLIAYLVYVFFISGQMLLTLCYVPFVISYALDVNWLFFGQENFKIILFRNVIIKVVTAVLIFWLVKSESDVVSYIMIMSVGALLSQLLIWIIVLKKHKLVRVKFCHIIQHLKPNLILFIPVIAVSVYRTMDKIMLGLMSNMTQVGYYENAEKIVSILLSFITALGTVMLPRMSALFESKDKKQIDKMLNSSIVFVSFVASIVAFGVAAIANTLVVVYYGKDYFSSGIILQLLCITVPFISYANIVRMQVLVPQGKDRAYVLSCFVGAVVNLGINAVLIPQFQAVGAAIGTIVAEFSVLFIQFIFAKEELHISTNKKSIFCFWINGLIMFTTIFILLETSYSLIGLIEQIAFGAIVYLILLFIQWKVFKDDNINYVVGKLLNVMRSKGDRT